MTEQPEPMADLEAGFTRVDSQPDPALLVTGMEQTAAWPSVRQLRAWERERLGLSAGQSLLDVGCGLADAALALADALAPGGRVLGVDASEAMLAVARERTADAPVPMTFEVGDATALGQSDASFDAARSERMLQWVPDPKAAVAELVRVVRPGGAISLTDSDWRTFTADVDAHDEFVAVTTAMNTMRGPSSQVGGRLAGMARDAGLVDVVHTAATHTWTEWDPDATPNPPGIFPMRQVLGQLADHDLVSAEFVDRVMDELEDRARSGRLFMSLTMFAVVGRRPR